ncbi:MAG: hypothetical protein ACRYGO_07420 [Janthinobacterium lividum]
MFHAAIDDPARINRVEVLVSDKEKRSAKEVAKAAGLGLSAWYRSLGNEAIRRHGTGPASGKESRHCPGPGRPAARARGVNNGRRHL